MTHPEFTSTAREADVTDLVPSISIENPLRLRTSVIERIEQAVSLLREANDIAAAGHFGELDVRVYSDGRASCPFSAADIMQCVQRQIDSAGWDHLLAQSGLRTFMDATARRTWDEQIGKRQIPALTRENIAATFERLYGSRRDMFERGVIECFRRLSWDNRTNQPSRFGKRLILKCLFERPRSSTDRWLWLNSGAANELDDLARVLAVLAGKVEPDHRQGMHSELRRAQNAGKMSWDGDYFTLRWYWKGTGHLTFKRMDLVEQMNVILAKHFPCALPAPRL